MRVLLLPALLLVAALAGCVDDQPAAEAPPAPPVEEPGHFSLDGHPEFCESEASCDFWDELYHEYVVYDLDTTVFDVVVVPPVGSDPIAHTDAARKAVEAWGAGIHHFAAPWLNGSFAMNVYVVGEDIPTVDAVEDPEIIVVSSGAMGILGIGLEAKQIGCSLLGEQALHAYPVHRHGAADVRAYDCTGTGFTCFAINAGGSEVRGLYDLIAHEVGHCLGTGHVGDALDFRARYAPVQDIMSYQNDADQVHCVSNMNVRSLEGVYAHLVDGSNTTSLPAGSYLDFEPRLYAQAPCTNPDA